jgi:hypothetical protein
LVQGPPGTGKTAFITEAVVQLLRSDANARVLIVSQTHVALDNALERLDHAGVPNLIRLGQAEDPRIATSTRHLLFDNQMAAWARSIRRRAEGHLEREANAAGISADYLRAGLALQEYLDVCLKLERLELALIQEEANPGTELTTSLGVSEDAVNLQSRIDALAIQRQELAEHAGGFLSGDLTISADLTVEDARAALALVVGETGSGDRLLQLLGLQAEWLQRLESDRNLAAAFLETSRVVAGTCLGFLRHPAVRDLEFDICILDEASKATATEALVPLARAKKWILVGDTRQLPPIDEELLRNTELMREYSISEAAISETLFQRLADGLPSHSQELLREQYRMIAPIGDLISTCFYDGELHSPRTDSLRGYESFGRPVLWMDTSGMGDRRREQSPAGSSTSFSNRTEARVVRDRLITLEGALTKGLLAPPDGAGKLDVLVIAPYRAQVEELRLRLAETSFSQLEYTVQSVDAVQGREADLAIFSVTRSNSNGRLGFLGHEYWRRINVALSRAKYGLTIVGDAAFCRSVPGALRTVHEYMTTHPATCEIRVVDHAS